MSTPLEHTWTPLDPCPCGCSTVAHKLSVKSGHVVGCVCMSCRNRRNQKKGKAGQALMHKRLGGSGFTPSNEESARPYPVEITVMPESKVGAQPPKCWDDFLKTEWFRKALDQSTRAVPVGSGAHPCVVIRGAWAVIDIRGRKR